MRNVDRPPGVAGMTEPHPADRLKAMADALPADDPAGQAARWAWTLAVQTRDYLGQERTEGYTGGSRVLRAQRDLLLRTLAGDGGEA